MDNATKRDYEDYINHLQAGEVFRKGVYAVTGFLLGVAITLAFLGFQIWDAIKHLV